jgi:dienelactone hydrolase
VNHFYVRAFWSWRFCRTSALLALRAYFAGTCALSQTQKPVDLLPPGQIVDVTCKSDAAQGYALYLPSSYIPEKRWPIIYFFDPGGHGRRPLELYKDIAETYGFILAGSNNSRNFSSEQGKAVNAVWQDTHARLAIDEHRSYASGFSGGARVAGAMALSGPTGQVAGVIAHGAGYPSNKDVSKDDLPYFFAVGDQDFNWPEVINIRREREEQGSPFRVRVYAGRHQWAPASVMEEAVQYVNLKAMQARNLAADEAFIDRLLDKTKAEAADAEARKDPIAQLSAYRALISDFGGLRDVKEAAQKLTALQQSPALKAALKSEREQMSEQLKLEQEVSQKIASVADNSVADIVALRLAVRQQMGALNDQAKHSKNEQKRLISGRAFSGIFVGAMEDGQQQLAERHFEKAEAYFDLMRQVSDDPWPVLLLADTHAAAGNRKLAIKELQEAVRRGLKDRAVIESDPQLQGLKSEPEFQKVVAGLEGK